jgi:hypothetical protein
LEIFHMKYGSREYLDKSLNQAMSVILQRIRLKMKPI